MRAAWAGASASRSRFTCTSTVRSSMKTWSPQTRSSSWPRLCTRSDAVISAAGGTRSGRGAVRAPPRIAVARDGSPGRAQAADRRPTRPVPPAPCAAARADPRQQLVGGRLGEVVVGPGVEARHLVGLVGARGQHDDGQRPRARRRPPARAPAPGPIAGSIQSSSTRSGSTPSTPRCACAAWRRASPRARHGAGSSRSARRSPLRPRPPGWPSPALIARSIRRRRAVVAHVGRP